MQHKSVELVRRRLCLASDVCALNRGGLAESELCLEEPFGRTCQCLRAAKILFPILQFGRTPICDTKRKVPGPSRRKRSQKVFRLHHLAAYEGISPREPTGFSCRFLACILLTLENIPFGLITFSVRSTTSGVADNLDDRRYKSTRSISISAKRRSIP
jgi:hypothetical protein